MGEKLAGQGVSKAIIKGRQLPIYDDTLEMNQVNKPNSEKHTQIVKRLNDTITYKHNYLKILRTVPAPSF